MKQFTLLLALALTACQQPIHKPSVATPVDYVSTLVGSQSDHSLSTGNLYPLTALPWGMNFWTPVTGKMGNGWAYTYDAHRIRGFKQTHQPSPWINDYGQFAVMPVRDASQVDEEARASFFSHQSETAKPYYYQVYLADHDVNVELTPSERSAVFRFTFPESSTSGVVVDAFDPHASITASPNRKRLVGITTNNSGGVPDNFANYFVLEFSKPFSSYDIQADKAVVRFDTHRGEQVEVYVSSSFISAEQALLNLQEVAGRPFDAVCQAAKDSWNEVLGRIVVGTDNIDQLRTFYSCLFRATMFPHKFYEINAQGQQVHYSPFNGEVCNGPLYTDSGYWDVFRALFPLLNLVYPSVSAEIQKGFVCTAQENEFLPEWASPGHRNCMVGNNSASIAADAYLKGISGKDMEKVYAAIAYGTEHVHPSVPSSGRLGHEYYNTMGYIPYDVGVRENVARTLEYSYNDWCILQMARKMGRLDSETDKWASRARNYRNVFDRSTNLMRGRNADGTFQVPFNPYKWGDAFTEGNAWHYTWSVFHDVQGLIDLMGGNDSFVQMLDSVFVVPPIYDDSYYHFRIHEITEMQVANMGNYAHGNQPAQHIIYLYDYAGQPWKCQQWVRKVMDQLYSARPDGYCGDEDNGQTSAWYIFSSLGFYPVCPGTDQYVIGSPLFTHATIHLENGNDICIEAPQNSPENVYIQQVTLNGKDYTRNFFTYGDLQQGADIRFDMGNQPDTTRATAPADRPYSFSNEPSNQ
ncbi:MAG: GH92 family glycosyl hydrolase [Bacteroidales bacterium]|nr:GH92 family glycosyl hydrolase [Bacteroidales bacterium]